MTNNNILEFPGASFDVEIDSDIQDLDKCIAIYKAQLVQGSIQKAYHYLMRYLMHLKAEL